MAGAKRDLRAQGLHLQHRKGQRILLGDALVPAFVQVRLAQCKRIGECYADKELRVGRTRLHDRLLGTLGEGECALVGTLGSCSRAARLLERKRPKLRLIDGERLVALFLKNYARFSARYRTLIPLKRIYIPDVVGEE